MIINTNHGRRFRWILYVLTIRIPNMVFSPYKGEVGCSIIVRGSMRMFVSTSDWKRSIIDALSVDNSKLLSWKNIPYWAAICLASRASELRTIRVKIFERKAASIVHETSGLPHNSTNFFRSCHLLPARAGIKAITVWFDNAHSPE